MAACPEYVEGPLVLSVHFNVSEVKKCSPHLGYRLAKRPTLQAATHPTGPMSPKPETFDGLSNPKSPQCLAIPESLEAKSKGKRKSPVSDRIPVFPASIAFECQKFVFWYCPPNRKRSILNARKYLNRVTREYRSC